MSFSIEEVNVLAPRPRPSDRIPVEYSIVVVDPTRGILTQLYNCYRHPEDGPVELTLRSPGERANVTVQIATLTNMAENTTTGSTHFAGTTVGGDSISGHVRPGPYRQNELVGKATLVV